MNQELDDISIEVIKNISAQNMPSLIRKYIALRAHAFDNRDEVEVIENRPDMGDINPDTIFILATRGEGEAKEVVGGCRLLVFRPGKKSILPMETDAFNDMVKAKLSDIDFNKVSYAFGGICVAPEMRRLGLAAKLQSLIRPVCIENGISLSIGDVVLFNIDRTIRNAQTTKRDFVVLGEHSDSKGFKRSLIAASYDPNIVLKDKDSEVKR